MPKAIATDEQMSDILKGFWTSERKAEMKRVAIEIGGEDNPNYGAAMKVIWNAAGAKEEVKAEYIRITTKTEG
jgi:hypothetical protein